MTNTLKKFSLHQSREKFSRDFACLSIFRYPTILVIYTRVLKNDQPRSRNEIIAIENRGTEPMDEKIDQSKASSDGQALSQEEPVLISEDDPTFLVRPEVLKGRLIGDERVRYEISQ